MELDLWQIVLLAFVQGVTEFLPISSSGHLVILAGLMSPQDGKLPHILDLSIVLHLGTLMSILVFYWQRVWRLIGEDRRIIGLLIVGTLPAVIVGLPLKKLTKARHDDVAMVATAGDSSSTAGNVAGHAWYEGVLESPLVAGSLLPVTGFVLLLAARYRHPRQEEYQQLSYGKTLLIGFSQAAAILPGLSRSGVTISAGMSLGLSPRSAATFSFLLAIPAIAGAGVLEVADMVKESSAPTTPVSHLLIGAVVSFVVGLAALSWLVRLLEKGRLQWFAWWCIPAGIGVIIWQLMLRAG
jgi:undecaprenyl-diphosphatase